MRGGMLSGKLPEAEATAVKARTQLSAVSAPVGVCPNATAYAHAS